MENKKIIKRVQIGSLDTRTLLELAEKAGLPYLPKSSFISLLRKTRQFLPSLLLNEKEKKGVIISFGQPFQLYL